MLLFQIADESWAIAAADVKDLIPRVSLQPYTQPASELVGGAPLQTRSRIAGLLNYHDEYVPVIDVSHTIADRQAPNALSTRIAIVESPVDTVPVDTVTEDSSANDKTLAQPTRKLGLILERAYETTHLSHVVDLPAKSAYVKAMLQDSSQVVRQLAIAPFFETFFGNSLLQ